MDTAGIPYKVHQCSKCTGDTKYLCRVCSCDLCPQCNKNHLKTYGHNSVKYQEKMNNVEQEVCEKHLNSVYYKHCESCDVPFCRHCKQHENHRQLEIGSAYETKRNQHRETIHKIRSETRFYRPPLLSGIKTDFKTCHTKLSFFQSQILIKAKMLTNIINFLLKDQ